MTQTILLADDSKTVQRAAEMVLAKEEFKLVGVKGGPELIETAKSQQPNVIIIDHALPNGSLSEMCGALKADPKTAAIPVIALTSANARLDQNQLKTLGVVGLLPKPFDSEQLLTSLQNAVTVSVQAAAASQHFAEQPTLVPPPPFMQKQPVAAKEAAKDPALPLDKSRIEAMTREIIERVVWEVVPQMAETLIREEINRLMHKNP